MKAKIKKIEQGKGYFVLDYNGEVIGHISGRDKRMIEWMEEKGIWNDGDEMEIDTKYPIVTTGSMLYAIDDPEKKPYRWKIWDDAERCSECYDFIDPEEASYTFKLKLPWNK